MPIRLPTASRNAAADAITARFDAGSGASTIQVRSGSQPASAGDAASGSLLATFTLDDPAFDAVDVGSSPLAGTPLETTGAADGTAGWCRALTSDGATVMDGSVSVTGGGGDFQLNTVAISENVNVVMTAGSITMPTG